MTTQPEAILKNNLVEQLKGLRYSFVHINNEDGILSNLVLVPKAFGSTTGASLPAMECLMARLVPGYV